MEKPSLYVYKFSQDIITTSDEGLHNAGSGDPTTGKPEWSSLDPIDMSN